MRFQRQFLRLLLSVSRLSASAISVAAFRCKRCRQIDGAVIGCRQIISGSLIIVFGLTAMGAVRVLLLVAKHFSPLHSITFSRSPIIGLLRLSSFLPLGSAGAPCKVRYRRGEFAGRQRYRKTGRDMLRCADSDQCRRKANHQGTGAHHVPSSALAMDYISLFASTPSIASPERITNAAASTIRSLAAVCAENHHE